MPRIITCFGFIVAIVFSSGCASTQTGTFIDRQSGDDLRVVSFNVNWDAIFPDEDTRNHKWRTSDKRTEFARVVRALNPDVLCIQEINPDRDAQDVANVMDEVIPLPEKAKWHAVIGGDNVTISRMPVKLLATQTNPQGGKPQCIALIDLDDTRFSQDLCILNEHFKCCGNPGDEEQRQQQADGITNWIRDAKSSGGDIDLAFGTAYIVLGDLNIVQGMQPIHTLVTGDIQNESTYGPDLLPDWDDTELTDLHPLHNVKGPDDYTWRDDTKPYKPARLDYMIYSDSVLKVTNCFVLNTLIMSDADLQACRLEKFDVAINAPGEIDHFPLVADFRMTPIGG